MQNQLSIHSFLDTQNGIFLPLILEILLHLLHTVKLFGR